MTYKQFWFSVLVVVVVHVAIFIAYGDPTPVMIPW